MSRALIAVVTLAAVAACAKPQNDAAAAADTTKAPVAAPAADTTKPAADSVKPAADSAKPAAPKPAATPAAKAETGDHDKFVKPKFKIDENTGKIDTIRKP